MYISDLTIILIVFIVILMFRRPILKASAKYEHIPTEYPIVFPLEPMFENYDSIKDEIFDCSTSEELNKTYVRIIIFESCYEGSAPFTSELWEMYLEQEKIIADYSCRRP